MKTAENVNSLNESARVSHVSKKRDLFRNISRTDERQSFSYDRWAGGLRH